ncbi:MAG: efflux RND transporter periplasmic adaptor subunit [Vicinamibacteria bacterium]|nr:efflux RND transporter periplasmic adaptor subunit [Vicinamibacteria bacterium]
MTRSTLVRAAALVALGLAATVPLARRARSAEPAAPPPAPRVRVATPIVAAVEDVHEYPGHVEAVERVVLQPKVGGYLEAVLFEEGARVARGQLLARIDARPYRVAVAEAEAHLQRARAEAEAARSEAERAQRLLTRQATSQEDAERRAANRTIAESQLAAAEAAVARARLDLGFTELRAPIAGRIGRALLTPGNLVDTDSELAVLVSLDPVYVRFDVEESRLAGGAAPASWQVRFAAGGAAGEARGRIAFVDNEVGHGTGTVRVRATFANPRGALMPGMFGGVRLALGAPAPALLVDERAIGTDQGQRYVLTVGAHNQLAYRPVRTGARHGALRVIEQGLAAEDRVVLDGLARVRPGLVVEPAEVAMDPAKGE